uniref:Exostosin-2 n=1 Tax=Strigamia maritima TaxID=126957 RepID=T1JB76_STRMM
MGALKKRSPYQTFYTLLFVVLIFILLLVPLILFWPWSYSTHSYSYQFTDLNEEIQVILPRNSAKSNPTDTSCHYYNCFDVYKCGRMREHKMTVYVYPLFKFFDTSGERIMHSVSKEFHDILEAIIDSPFHTKDPGEACLFIPPVDLLNQNNVNLENAAKVLRWLPFWHHGVNHVIFNMLPGTIPDFNTSLDVPHDKAVIAGGGFSSWTYRRGFDISIPLFNPFTSYLNLPEKSIESPRKWLTVSSQTNIHYEYRQEFLGLHDEHPEFLVLDKCPDGLAHNISFRCSDEHVYEYPKILQDSTFCLVVRGARLGQTVLFDTLKSGCIPVIIADTYILPFSEFIDWKIASISIFEDEISDLMSILKSISEERIIEMRKQVAFLFDSYFKSIKLITHTTLQIINDRIFPHTAKPKSHWNERPNTAAVKSPLFLPLIAPKNLGFTAVILTYDRIDSLFQVIQKVVKAPSLAKVLVVWNNQNKEPPPASMWPKINKPLKVKKTSENKLSNRFFPYEEIETEAILAIDDDIIMLTADELEFGFEVWREFPERIVGYPSRVHLWDNSTQRWKYESEWTNELSMVLTGAAFYHKYWSYMYTTSMPGDIKQWVDDHMNCEDIAMNFLVTNMTGKAPIKVAPRKKFKCPECIHTEMLSADLSHMMERSECVNKFAQVYGCVPLKPVEFRADPVLFKDNFPEKLKRFNDIGSL